MTWYAVINSATGASVSFGSVLADPLPDGLEAIEIDHQPGAGERWDPDTRAVVTVEDTRPNPVAFFTALAVVLGGGDSDQQRAAGASRLAAIDRDYRGIRDYINQGEWTIPLALISACLLDEVITQQEYEAVQLAWDAAHLGRPATE